MNCCPTCKRPFAPAIDVGSGARRKVYDMIAARPDGISAEEIINRLYAHRPDGGPLQARKIIHTYVYQLNGLLREKNAGVLIGSTGGMGAVYRLVKPEQWWRRFDDDARKVVAETKGPTRTVGARFGISANTVRKWRARYLNGASCS